MRRPPITLSVMAFLITFILTSPASAAWNFGIVETSDNVYDFVLFTDDSIIFDGGTGSFNYDNWETLDWTYTFSYPSPLIELFGSPYETTAGDIDNLTGACFTNHAVTLTEDTVLATFTFTGDGDANFRFDMDDSTMKFEINDIIYAAVDYPELYGASVPVPAAVWLLGSGLLGLVGLRRRNK